MKFRLSVFVVAASALLMAGCATSDHIPIWEAAPIAASPQPKVQLSTQGKVVASVDTEQIRRLIDVKERIEKAAGVGQVELVITIGDEPNAFAGVHPKLGRVVGVNTAMLKLLGTDWDGYAAVIGHEYAHLALEHGAKRKEREDIRESVSSVLGVVLGSVGVPMGSTIAEISTQTVTTVYSRDEEREADYKGVEYMVTAGFDPRGAVRTWERMEAAGHGDALVPFLSTHPMTSERIENMRKLAAAPPATQVARGARQAKVPEASGGSPQKVETPASSLAYAAPAAAPDTPPEQDARTRQKLAVVKEVARRVGNCDGEAKLRNTTAGRELYDVECPPHKASVFCEFFESEIVFDATEAPWYRYTVVDPQGRKTPPCFYTGKGKT